MAEVPEPLLARRLEELYETYNRRRWVRPDPVQFLYAYQESADREIAALVASSLAYGRVAQIVRNVGAVLDRMGEPARFLRRASEEKLRRFFRGFRHRFAGPGHLTALLLGAKRAIQRYGSLRNCFLAGLLPTDETVLPALGRFAEELGAGGACGHLLPSPQSGSACKRLNLFLRWMVRRDRVDPGGWSEVGAHRLIVPLDVHMHRVCTALGMTRRKSADRLTALEITRQFARLVPRDPVRYDFSLTRLALRGEEEVAAFLVSCGVGAPRKTGRGKATSRRG